MVATTITLSMFPEGLMASGLGVWLSVCLQPGSFVSGRMIENISGLLGSIARVIAFSLPTFPSV